MKRRVPWADLGMLTALTLLVSVLGNAPAQDEYGDAVSSDGRVYARWAWNNAEVRSIFAQVAAASGVDIVVDPRVTGRLTLTLTDKTWQDVLMIVCRMKKLTPVKEESQRYVYVMNDTDYREEQRDRLSSADFLEAVQPRRREIIPISNVRAAEMQSAIQKLLSDRGEVTVVEHNNSLIVFDTERNIRQVKEVIAQLDVETAQISIAAKIIEVSSGTLQNLGIQWGFFGELGGREISAQHLPGADPISNAIDRLTYGILSSDRFALTMDYLFQDNKGKVVAQPSITTIDNKEASIFMGEQVRTVVSDEARNAIVKFVPAGTNLTVTPHVTDGNRIMLNIIAGKESPDPVSGNIKSQNATTNVVVSDGETVVIAGLTSNTEVESEEGIPVLKDIPLIGNLFKRSNKNASKADLLIFVTPNIIRKNVDAALAPAAGTDATPGSSDEFE